MKKINSLSLMLLVLLIGSNYSYSQIQNASFESWDTTPWVQPTGWGVLINSLGDFITQSSDAHDGASSAKMEIKELLSELVEPAIESGGFGDPIDSRHNKLNLFYKSDFKNFARLKVHITTWDSSASTGSLFPSGSADTLIRNTTSNWTLLELPITYFNNADIPAYISITFVLEDSAESNDLSAVGSFVLIDDLTLDLATGVEVLDEVPYEFNLSQNYPNPFNPTTVIKYQIPKLKKQINSPNGHLGDNIQNSNKVSLIVYDLLGSEVATIVNERQPAGNYTVNFNGSDLTSGIYLIKLTAGNFVQTRKMTLLK